MLFGFVRKCLSLYTGTHAGALADAGFYVCLLYILVFTSRVAKSVS